MVVGASEGPLYDFVSDPVFSPDGRQVAYRAWKYYKWFIVAGSREGRRFDWVSDPAFSPDGTKIAFAAQDGREFWWKVVDAH
jgi:dipeptidyl aminopeptidase/acylaminoacyl peptidase